MRQTLLLFIFFLSPPAYTLAQEALLILNLESFEQTKGIINTLNKQGCSIKHIFPPRIIIGDLTPDVIRALPNESDIKYIYLDEVDKSIIAALDDKEEIFVSAWNLRLNKAKKPRDPQTIPGPQPSPLENDMMFVPEGVKGIKTFRVAPAAAPAGAGFYDTSEYMIGSVAVGIILHEDIWNFENWDPEREAEVTSEIMDGLNWWAAREPNAHLSFVYEFTYGRTDERAQTAWTPISDNSSNEKYWVRDIMTQFGYSETDYRGKVFHYNNDLRDRYKTDWAYTIFVVDSKNDYDGAFLNDDKSAYAYVGGPFVVMTYDNGGWGIDNMDFVIAHETGHIFYCMDEYAGSGNVSEFSGYLNVQNGNHETGGITNVDCIMRSKLPSFVSPAICQFSKHTLGWLDSDNDGNFDIIDTLRISLSQTGNNPVQPTFQVSMTSLPAYLNSNPGWKTRHDISIQKLNSARYRINSGTWSALTAKDGMFDETAEQADIQFPDLASGTYTIEIEAIGQYSTTVSSLSHTVPPYLVAKHNLDTNIVASHQLGDVEVTIPAGSFINNTTVLIYPHPSFPRTISNAANIKGLGLGADIKPLNISALPSKNIHMSVSYKNISLGEVKPENLRLAFYNPDTAKWEIIKKSSVNLVSQKIEAELDHLSLFQVVGFVPSPTLFAIKAYPNPIQMDANHTNVTFANLAKDTTIKIFTISGQFVRTLTDTDGNGIELWDIKNDWGHIVASGIYIFYAQSANGETKMGRIAVIK